MKNIQNTKAIKAKNVVITGGTSGLGKALVKGFAKGGNRVLFTSRNEANIWSTLEEVGRDATAGVVGVIVDIQHTPIQRAGHLRKNVEHHMPTGVDVWINNAAQSDRNTPLFENTDEEIEAMVETNLTSNILLSALAIDLCIKNATPDKMGHLFNVLGAGSDGWATPNYSVYGSTKAAILQFTRTLRQELRQLDCVGIHTLSPGMMPTPLLTANNESPTMKRIFNLLCEDPATIAEYFVPLIMRIVEKKEKAASLEYMTPLRIIRNLLSYNSRKGRFFPDVD